MLDFAAISGLKRPKNFRFVKNKELQNFICSIISIIFAQNVKL